jgi:hypothetical protein
MDAVSKSSGPSASARDGKKRGAVSVVIVSTSGGVRQGSVQVGESKEDGGQKSSTIWFSESSARRALDKVSRMTARVSLVNRETNDKSPKISAT